MKKREGKRKKKKDEAENAVTSPVKPIIAQGR